jgi:hypothetical protein
VRSATKKRAAAFRENTAAHLMTNQSNTSIRSFESAQAHIDPLLSENPARRLKRHQGDRLLSILDELAGEEGEG